MYIEPELRTQETFKNPNSIVDFHFYYRNSFHFHCHDFYEILIMTKGETLHSLENQTNILKKNEVVIIRPQELHQGFPYENRKSEHLTISIIKDAFYALCNTFSSSLFYNINNSIEPIHFRLNDNEFKYILYLANKINTLTPQEFEKESVEFSKLIILNLLIHLDSSSLLNTQCPDWLNDFLQTLSQPEYFTQPLGELYKLVPYSQSLLNRYFKQYVGKTMIAYITDIKINYACNMLKNTNYSILYISGLLEYESLAHFNRVFKKIVGVTPSVYRKDASKKPSDTEEVE